MTSTLRRLSVFIFCAVVIIFITTTCEAKNDDRMAEREEAEEVPLPMINDTNITLSANMTANNVTDLQDDTQNEEDNEENEEGTTDHDVGIAGNSTTSLEDPLPNATEPLPSNTSLVTTYVPSSSPTIETKATEFPTIENKATEFRSTNTPSISPGKHSITVPPITTSTVPIDVSLNIQSINIVILTDVHSWVRGHGRHEPKLNADYGNILSFYQRLQQQVQQLESKPDLYLVNNGDFLHGTILGDDPPEHLVGILERMPFDAITLGEHEIINSKSIEKLEEPGGLFDEWGERMVTSNIRRSGSSEGNLEPLGNNYLLLEGNQGSVLVLGFLYNLNENESASGITVADVQDVMEEGWFTSLFASCKHQPQFDAVVVLSHMDVRDELVTLLLSEFRKLCGQKMVVQFITGHTHIRSFAELDSHSSSIEAGRFLDTVGFVSFEPKLGSFAHNFIPANEKYLAQSIDMSEDEYHTHDGEELSEYIARTIDHTGAGNVLGCASKRYNEQDLLDMYLNEVMPKSFLNHNHASQDILLQFLDSFVGYDLFPGMITMGDIYTVVPQDYDIQSLGRITGSDVTRVMNEMSKVDRRLVNNSTNFVGLSMATESGKSTEIDSSIRYNLHTLSKDASKILSIMDDLGVKSSLNVVSSKTMRGMWIDYVQKNMPYDGNSCKCIEDLTGCSAGDASKTPPTSFHTSPQPRPTYPTSNYGSHPTSNHGSTVSAPAGGIHNSTIGAKGARPSKSHSSNSGFSSTEKSTSTLSSLNWMFVVVAGGIIFFVLRFGRRAAGRREFGTAGLNDLEMQVSPPPGYGDVSGGAGGYDSPHLGRYV
ncbi:hypothetical protein ACHAWT_009675 [Skeletonema menzelii]